MKDLETSIQRIARIEKENRKLTERVDMLECALREMNRTREQTNTAPQQNYQRPLQTRPQQAANLPPYTIRYVKCRHLPQAKCMHCPEYNMPQNNMDMQNMQNMQNTHKHHKQRNRNRSRKGSLNQRPQPIKPPSPALWSSSSVDMEDVEERTELQQRIHTQNHQHQRTQSNHDTQHPAAQQAELEAIARRAVRDAQELRAREAAGRM